MDSLIKDDRTGLAIKLARRKRRMSQEELAFLTDCDTTTIGRIERGDLSPTCITIRKIAGALGVQPWFFFKDDLVAMSGKDAARTALEDILYDATDGETVIIAGMLRGMVDVRGGNRGR